MATVLGAAINDLADPALALSDALRRLLIVGKRIEAKDLTDWVRNELDGYADDTEIPVYRRKAELPIGLKFDGPFNGSDTLTVFLEDLPTQLQIGSAFGSLCQSVSELKALSSGEHNPRIPLPPGWIGIYRGLAETESVPMRRGYVLNDAWITVPRTVIVGVLDRIRTVALDLVLNLEAISEHIGELGGPTVDTDSRIQTQINMHISTDNSVHNVGVTQGENLALAVGDGARVTQSAPTNVEELMEAAAQLLSSEGVSELAEAIKDDDGSPSESTRSFLERVRNESHLVATGVAASAAYTGLFDLVQYVFPAFT